MNCFLENTFQGKLDYRFIYNLRSHPPKDTIRLYQITYYKNTSCLMSTSYVPGTILNSFHICVGSLMLTVQGKNY